MITKEKFLEAMTIIEEYIYQLSLEEESEITNTSQIGCRVKLSTHGLEMQGSNKKKLVGSVIDFRKWMHYENSGTVTVKWDKIAIPVSMHITQVDSIK